MYSTLVKQWKIEISYPGQDVQRVDPPQHLIEYMEKYKTLPPFNKYVWNARPMQIHAMNVVSQFINERVEYHKNAMKQSNDMYAMRSGIALDGYSQESKDKARAAWWDYCEASKEPHVPTFRQFWNDEKTYELVA